MHADTIPTADDLTPSWFTELLRSTGDLDTSTSVVAADLRPFGHAESMMSALLRASLTYDRPVDAPATLIVKLASASERQRFIAGMFKFYEREVRFYRQLRSQVDVGTPRCFLAEIHPSDPYFVIVLEEVTGRRQVDQVEGVGLDDARLGVVTLADLHAPFWGRDLSGMADTFIPMNVPAMHAVIPAQFAADWDVARAKVVDELDPEVVALCDRHADVSSAVLDDLMGPDTLAHGDFRSDNLMFDGDRLLVLDFQLAAICHGMSDVAYFVSQSVQAEVAAAHADHLVDVYVARLAEHGVTCDRTAAMRAYRASLVFFLSIPISMLAGTDLPERADRLARTMLRRASAEILRTGAHRQYA